MTLLYRMMQRHVRNHYGIEMYDTATIGRRLEIGHQGAIVIHEYAVIGNDCTIRQAVTIGAAGSWSATTAPILGDHVDVGAGAKILGKIKVGDNTRIGPNVVLMTDLPAGAIAFVEPPRVLHLKARPDVRADPGRS
jgi:serine O-acetyltransferase